MARRVDHAKRLYEKWHEFKSDDTVEVDVPTPSGALRALGKMHRLDYTSDKWNKGKDVYYYHHFKKNPPLLCVDDAGNYFIDGNIKVTPLGIDDWDDVQKHPTVKTPTEAVTKLGTLELIAYEDPETKKAHTLMFGDRYYVGDPDEDFTYITSPVNIPTANPSVRHEIHNLLRANELPLDAIYSGHPQHAAARKVLAAAGLEEHCIELGGEERGNPRSGNYVVGQLYRLSDYPFPMVFTDDVECGPCFVSVTIPGYVEATVLVNNIDSTDVSGVWSDVCIYHTLLGWYNQLTVSEREKVLSNIILPHLGYEETIDRLARFSYAALPPNIQTRLENTFAGSYIENEAVNGEWAEFEYVYGDEVTVGGVPGIVEALGEVHNGLMYKVVFWAGDGDWYPAERLEEFAPYEEYSDLRSGAIAAVTPDIVRQIPEEVKFYAKRAGLVKKRYRVGCYYRTALCPVPGKLVTIDTMSSRPYKLLVGGKILVDADEDEMWPYDWNVGLRGLREKERIWLAKMVLSDERDTVVSVHDTDVGRLAEIAFGVWEGRYQARATNLLAYPYAEGGVEARTIPDWTRTKFGDFTIDLNTVVTLDVLEGSPRARVVGYSFDGVAYIVRTGTDARLYIDRVLLPNPAGSAESPSLLDRLVNTLGFGDPSTLTASFSSPEWDIPSEVGFEGSTAMMDEYRSEGYSVDGSTNLSIPFYKWLAVLRGTGMAFPVVHTTRYPRRIRDKFIGVWADESSRRVCECSRQPNNLYRIETLIDGTLRNPDVFPSELREFFAPGCRVVVLPKDSVNNGPPGYISDTMTDMAGNIYQIQGIMEMLELNREIHPVARKVASFQAASYLWRLEWLAPVSWHLGMRLPIFPTIEQVIDQLLGLPIKMMETPPARYPGQAIYYSYHPESGTTLVPYEALLPRAAVKLGFPSVAEMIGAYREDGYPTDTLNTPVCAAWPGGSRFFWQWAWAVNEHRDLLRGAPRAFTISWTPNYEEMEAGLSEMPVSAVWSEPAVERAPVQVPVRSTERERYAQLGRIDRLRILQLLGYPPESTNVTGTVEAEVLAFLRKYPTLPWMMDARSNPSIIGPTATVILETLATTTFEVIVGALLGKGAHENPSIGEWFVMLDSVKNYGEIRAYLKANDPDGWVTTPQRPSFGDPKQAEMAGSPVVFAQIDPKKLGQPFEESVIGMTGFTVNKYRNATLAWTVVNLNYRRKGVASGLVTFRDRFLKKLGVNRVFTSIKKNNRGSRNMMARQGYFVYDQTEDLLRVVKQIGEDRTHLPEPLNIPLEVPANE